MSKGKPTRAEQLRRHREIFEYAREHDLTLVEAEFAMLRDARAARLVRREAVLGCGRSLQPAIDSLKAMTEQALRPIPNNAPWMMRD